MKVTSLYALRQALQTYLTEKLPDVQSLAEMPTVRHPLGAESTVLVIGVQNLRRAEGFLSPSESGLLLEVGLTLTVCHRDSSEECERITGAIEALTTGSDFPFHLLSLQSHSVEFDRTIGAFLMKTECTVCCLLAEGEEATP